MKCNCFIPFKVSKMLVDKCIDNRLEEVSEIEFVRVCSIDSELGTVVVKIYRAFIGCWSFMYERWSSGVFFTQTKPPMGPSSRVTRLSVVTVSVISRAILGQYERLDVQHSGESHHQPRGGEEEEEGGRERSQ